jgi:tRNA-splicing endonuclease subunit Sen54
VTRAVPPNSFYPSAAPYPAKSKANEVAGIFNRILSTFSLCIHRVRRLLVRGFDWWHPVRISRWHQYDKNYGELSDLPSQCPIDSVYLLAYLFRSMRFMSAGYSIPLHHPKIEKRNEGKKLSPYQIFFNLYKPSTPFKRSAPPPPDFQIVVIK